MCTERDYEKQASPVLFHAGKTTNPELFMFQRKQGRKLFLNWLLKSCLLRGILKSRPALKSSTWTLKSRSAPKYFLLETRPALKSSTWDAKEQDSPEIFFVGKQASPEQFYLGCWRAGQPRNISSWKAGQPWKVLPWMLKSTPALKYFLLESGRPALKSSTWDIESRPALKYFLFESKPALKSFTWDAEEHASPEIFFVKKQASPEKFYLGCWRTGQPWKISCWKAGQPWKILPGMLRRAGQYWSISCLKASQTVLSDIEGQASPEKFYLGCWRTGQSWKFYLGCWRAGQPWKILPGMLESRNCTNPPEMLKNRFSHDIFWYPVCCLGLFFTRIYKCSPQFFAPGLLKWNLVLGFWKTSPLKILVLPGMLESRSNPKKQERNVSSPAGH